MAQRFINKPLNEEDVETVVEVERSYIGSFLATYGVLLLIFISILYTGLFLFLNKNNNDEIQKLSSQVFELQKPHKILNELGEIRNQNKKLVEKIRIEIKKQQESISNISQATDIVEAKIRCYRESTYKALDCSKDYVDYTKEKLGLD